MQVARLLGGRTTRSARGKFSQMLTALALERRLSKDAILQLYLTLAPYGGNVEGIRAAWLAYLGKEPRRLNPAEAALLVALPQAPEARRPDTHPERAQAARDRVLARAAETGVFTADDVATAATEPVPASRRRFPMLAAQTASRLVAEEKIHKLTLDAGLQGRQESLAGERARALAGSVSVAILVADHASGEILASRQYPCVGSRPSPPRHAAGSPRRPRRFGFDRQDDPQRDDEGTGSAGSRMRPGRPQGRRGRPCPGLSAQNLSGFRLAWSSAYMLERVMSYGARRAEEMRAVARTIDDIGIGPGGVMAAACVE